MDFETIAYSLRSVGMSAAALGMVHRELLLRPIGARAVAGLLGVWTLLTS